MFLKNLALGWQIYDIPIAGIMRSTLFAGMAWDGLLHHIIHSLKLRFWYFHVLFARDSSLRYGLWQCFKGLYKDFFVFFINLFLFYIYLNWRCCIFHSMIFGGVVTTADTGGAGADTDISTCTGGRSCLIWFRLVFLWAWILSHRTKIVLIEKAWAKD